MKLVFSLSTQDIEQRKDDISARVTGLFPGTSIKFDRARGMMTATVPKDTDKAQFSASVCRALAEIGVVAKPAIESGFDMMGLDMAPRKKRTVPLSVFIISLVAVVLCFSFLLFLFAGFEYTTLGNGEEECEDYIGKIALIDSIFDEFSLYNPEGQILLDEMLKAYAAATGDRYAAYYTQEEYEQLTSENAAKTVGIGISISMDVETGCIRVISVVEDSPALKAGVQAGDLIVAIGTADAREEVTALGYEVALDRLLGEAGTRAEFIVLRDGTEIPFSVERAEIKTVSVKAVVSETDPTVGIISISQFDIETPVQFKRAMESLKTAGCTQLVFDVRNNPGGDLNSIIAVLSYFLEKDQTILSTVMKDGSTTVFSATPVTHKQETGYASCNVAEEEIGMYRSYIGSITVLTNGYTASAAELFTIVMKDYGMATVVGTKTYGKGVIQSIIPLEEYGYEGAIKLTFGYYNPPISENYDGKGIEPHVVQELSEEAAKKGIYALTEAEDDQLQAAIQALKSSN